MSIRELVEDRRVCFSHYDGFRRELWYTVLPGLSGLRSFDFPVPIDDAAGATFMADDRAILFMRWIRKHVKLIEEEELARLTGERDALASEVTRLVRENDDMRRLTKGPRRSICDCDPPLIVCSLCGAAEGEE